MKHISGPWGIMHDGPKGDGLPWKAYMETAPGLTVGSIHHTEPIARVSGYLMDVEANAQLIAQAPAMKGQLETGIQAIEEAIRHFTQKEDSLAFAALKGVIAGNEMALAKVEGG